MRFPKGSLFLREIKLLLSVGRKLKATASYSVAYLKQDVLQFISSPTHPLQVKSQMWEFVNPLFGATLKYPRAVRF